MIPGLDMRFSEIFEDQLELIKSLSDILAKSRYKNIRPPGRPCGTTIRPLGGTRLDRCLYLYSPGMCVIAWGTSPLDVNLI